MADNHDRYEGNGAGGGFMMGLLTGTVLGAGLGMLLAPKAGSELRDEIGEQAKHLGSYAADQYRKAGGTASDWAERGRTVVDRAREAVSQGVNEARQYAGRATGSSYSDSESSFGTAGSFGGGASSSSTTGTSPYGSGTGPSTDFDRS